MKTYFIDLNTRCTICDRKVSITQEWTRSVSGIRHAFCPEPEEIDGEWITEWLCRSCAAPVDRENPVCPLCGPTEAKKSREWICRRHCPPCMCWPEEAGTDEVPW